MGYEDAEEGVVIYEKDDLTLKETLQIFVDYFENLLPEIKDWHAFNYKH